MNTLLVPLVTGAEVTFWVVAPLTILGALGLVLSRRAVYAALSVAVTMMGLAALYASLDAPFLAMVQIIVYTGAVLMMFLFVLMMVGITTPDSTVETLKGQRPLAILGGIGILAFLFFAIGGALGYLMQMVGKYMFSGGGASSSAEPEAAPAADEPLQRNERHDGH